MSKITIRHRATALFFLIIFSLEIFYPTVSYALTSGPTTPEMSAFEPATTANMVDMFSGDFSYNIPLLDVGGYPVNLAYHSGAGPEEEASWVGFGWSLNPGAINRQLRGLPDDFAGEVLKQEDHKKDNKTIGANINVSLKLFAIRFPKLKRKKINGKGKVKIGIMYNNYTGYKGVFGIGTAFNSSNENSDVNTKGLGLSGNVGINVDNQSGINPYADYELNYKIQAEKEKIAETNLKEAEDLMQGKTPVQSTTNSSVNCEKTSPASVAKAAKLLSFERNSGANLGASSAIDFNGFQAPASVQIPMESTNFTASLELGVTFFGGTVTPGIEGSLSKQKIKDVNNEAPAYGFMNSHLAKSNEDAVLDYNMEKNAPYIKRLPNLGVTVFTPDLYNVTSNAGSMQFRPFLKGTGIFSQPHKHDKDVTAAIGIQPAFGVLFHIGIPLQLNKTNNISGKWTSHNDYLDKGNFKSTSSTDPTNQAFYFKRVGEKNKQDQNYFDKIGKTSAVAVKLSSNPGTWAFGKGKATEVLKVNNGADIVTGGANTQERNIKDKANNSITYLTGTEASKYALDKSIPNYIPGMLPTEAGAKQPISRTSGYRNPNHISQYTITQDDGQRMVYGTPVYNTEQEEVSFAIDGNNLPQDGIVKYSGNDNTSSNQKGKDNYYHKSRLPAYTTGHLLTGILSPDYVDKTGDGITDDDLGTAVKFNYTQLTAPGNLYNWRTPYSRAFGNQKTANFAEGYKNIPDDNKANYTWGTKELWNVHSIESKTMVAQFITENRNDAIGVINADGDKNTGDMMKRLKEIRLYSKADLYANAGNLSNILPIKTVHFEYFEDYPLLTLLPNNKTNQGKLTLKKIWFTYGKSDKGKYNSYNFQYKIPSGNNSAYNTYNDNQSDRWGSFKPADKNPSGLNNIEYPYTVQNKTLCDDFAGYWQLNEIELPSGGVINVEYESDDYSYVQNRRAAQMCPMAGIGQNGSGTNFAQSDKIFVKLPAPCTNADLKKRYFQNVRSIAYKALVDIDGKAHPEWVTGYAEIAGNPIMVSNDVVQITVKKVNDKYNPIAKAAWQKLKLDLPRFAYAEYDNLDSENSGFISAIRALGATFARFGDLVESFDKRAIRKGFGNNVDLSKSFVRLCTPVGINSEIKGKLGGGHRVKEIRINDKWAILSGAANAESGAYGQTYDYTTQDAVLGKISSGVASYEPTTGGDENPFREPINYSDRHFLSKPKYFFLERPMGEAFFPGASVGYSKVTVRNIGADGSIGATGTSVSEFYTAKDFPTKVDEVPIQRTQPNLSFLPRLFGAKITSAVTVSQGYVIENNDMHGKQKAEGVYGKNGDKISSSQYYYKVKKPSAETQELDNSADVILRSGAIEAQQTVGMDIEMFTEMNESMMENLGVAVDPAFGVHSIVPPLPRIRLPLPKPNYEQRKYRGSTTTKLVNRYGILQKVVKTTNGSTNTSENMLWDAETGEVLLTKTNNEFDKSQYSFSYPAHWVYDGMGSAFKNEGTYLTGFASDATGRITNYNNILVPGDEIIDLVGNTKYWVSKPGYNGSQNLYLIDMNGTPRQLTTEVKILRSGRRNLASASVGTVISMENPISNNSINFGFSTKILQAKAVNYEEYWPMPVAYNAGPATVYTPTDCQSTGNRSIGEGDTLYTMQKNAKGIMETRKAISTTDNNAWPSPTTSCNCKCLKKLFDYLIVTNQLFITQAQNRTVGQLVTLANNAGYNVGTCSVLDNNLNKPFYALTNGTTSTTYIAQLGDCKVSIRSNSQNPVTFTALTSQPCGTSPVVNYVSSSGTQTIFNTYATSCAQNHSYYNPAGVDNNSDKLVTSNGQSIPNHLNHFNNSQFKIPGISIPSNATIVSANLFLYAYPGGFRQPDHPNAHNPGSTAYVAHIATLWDCVQTVNGWQIPTGYPRCNSVVTTGFNDVVCNFIGLASRIQQGTYVDYGFGLIGDGIIDNYQTFCSNNYPNPAKRPRLEITYTIPSPSTSVIATLQIDECSGAASCTPPIVNPYFTGILGNWRAKTEYLYDTKRINNVLNNTVQSGTDLQNSGYFSSYANFWLNNAGNWYSNEQNNTTGNWRWTSQTTKYNRKGQEVENRDALDRYNASQYGYLESVPVAVANNAHYREIGYDGFEDYNFNLGNNLAPWDSCGIQDHFSFRNFMGSAAMLDGSTSHTGKYSMKLNGTVAINKPIMQTEPYLIYAIAGTNNNQYQITEGYLRWGFLPMPLKKYVLSGWVKDGQPRTAGIAGLTLKISGTTYDLNANNAMASKVIIAEGWKRFEIAFDMPASGKFNLELGGSNINVDDIRIHPYDAQLKSYAYDATSMRLMADLDENNFATFYEYDDEGTLIRVKKETEKGISTIKETRSSIRRKLP